MIGARLRVALIGYGYWGPNLARNFASSSSTELVAICDSSESRRSSAASQYRSVQVCSTLEEVLSLENIDAVAIATPTGSHYAIARAALEKGLHVFVEKPLTDSTASAAELVALAESRSLILHVDHTFVYTEAVRTLKRLVESGDIGDLLYFDSTRVNLGLFQPDVNVIWDLAVHDLSILQFVTNKQVCRVSATGLRHPRATQESAAFMTLFYDDNFAAHIDVSWMSPVKLRRTLLSGTKKMVVYDDLETTEKLKIYDSGVDISDDPDTVRQALIAYRIGDMVAPKIPSTEALQVEVNHFADAIRKQQPTLTDGRLGLELVRILEAASESMASDGSPVSIVRE